MNILNTLKIISDGTPQGTFVYDVDGSKITAPISDIQIEIKAGEPVRAKITFAFVELEVTTPEPSVAEG